MNHNEMAGTASQSEPTYTTTFTLTEAADFILQHSANMSGQTKEEFLEYLVNRYIGQLVIESFDKECVLYEPDNWFGDEMADHINCMAIHYNVKNGYPAAIVGGDMWAAQIRYHARMAEDYGDDPSGAAHWIAQFCYIHCGAEELHWTPREFMRCYDMEFDLKAGITDEFLLDCRESFIVLRDEHNLDPEVAQRMKKRLVERLVLGANDAILCSFSRRRHRRNSANKAPKNSHFKLKSSENTEKTEQPTRSPLKAFKHFGQIGQQLLFPRYHILEFEYVLLDGRIGDGAGEV